LLASLSILCGVLVRKREEFLNGERELSVTGMIGGIHCYRNVVRMTDENIKESLSHKSNMSILVCSTAAIQACISETYNGTGVLLINKTNEQTTGRTVLTPGAIKAVGL